MDYSALGKVAYEAYFVHSNGVSLINGEPLPMWDELNNNIRLAWTVAAKAVVIREAVRRTTTPPSAVYVSDEERNG